MTSRDTQPGQRPADLPLEAVADAMGLVGAVRDYGPGEVAEVLAPMDRQQLLAVAVALAAMVPTDKTAGELLAWNDDRQEVLPLRFPPGVKDRSKRAFELLRGVS